ncbi:hypothetical protein GBA52_026949 [Prunus armeniaca]|nr:hypothetical protein GBA52_026949 [Prunus armeniaca]
MGKNKSKGGGKTRSESEHCASTVFASNLPYSFINSQGTQANFFVAIKQATIDLESKPDLKRTSRIFLRSDCSQA